MSWTQMETDIFRIMYAANATYVQICAALDKRMGQVRAKWRRERKAGTLAGLTEQRRRSRLSQESHRYTLYVENGVVIKRYPPAYAQGCMPAIGALAKNRVEQ